jgi:hypothetical protein
MYFYSPYKHFWLVQGQLYLHLPVVNFKMSSVATENYIVSSKVSFDREIRKGMEEVMAAI